jgi:glucose-1-phosphate adenylyltransferase
VIHTQSSQRPGADITEMANIENSLICDGCRVEGYVTRSIISPGVEIAPDATVRDSIILNDTRIGSGAVVDRCVVDEGVQIDEGVLLGDGQDNTPNRETPDRLNTGLTLVGMRAHVPAGARVGRNVIIRPRTDAEAFTQHNVVPSGATLGR